MSIHSFDVGDKVVCNPDEVSPAYCGTVYTLVQKLKVNVVLEPVGGGKRLKINPAYLLPAPSEGEPPAAVGVPYRAPLQAGAVVSVAGHKWRGSDGLHVVLDDDAQRTKVALLGGDPQHPYRYWRVPRAWVTEISRDALLAAVAGLSGVSR